MPQNDKYISRDNGKPFYINVFLLKKSDPESTEAIFRIPLICNDLCLYCKLKILKK